MLIRLALWSRRPGFPLVVMLGFFGLLCGILALRVSWLDGTLAERRLATCQAQLAAETAVHQGLVRMRQLLSEHGGGLPLVQTESLPDYWRKSGVLTDSWSRLTEMRSLPGIDDPTTALLDESSLYRVGGEGKCQGTTYRAFGTVGIVPLVKKFAVFNSLNGYYYGRPLQPWIQDAGGFETFRRTNRKLFDEGRINRYGITHDPDLLVKMFMPAGSDPFTPPAGKAPLKNNYGTLFYSRDGTSPCHGPLYCSTPIVVDSHLFLGPVQTAAWLYRRGENQPRIQRDNEVLALPSSRRIQAVVDRSEGDPPAGPFVDADSFPRTGWIAPWRPDFAALRAYAQKEGIYIDANGKGFRRGQPTTVDYHFEPRKLYSETYLGPVSGLLQQDEITEGTITLATANRFQDRNNLDLESLQGANLLFSEIPILIRGELGGDLTIVTPRHILLTGSTNSEQPKHLMLVAGNGIGLSTTDLEEFILKNQVSQDVVAAARQWIVNGVLYKPGAGWYGTWSKPMDESTTAPILPLGSVSGQRVSVTIRGACLEGTLERWIDLASPEGVKIEWVPEAADRLPFPPVSATLLRLRIAPLL